jgi:hypothetical protein
LHDVKASIRATSTAASARSSGAVRLPPALEIQADHRSQSWPPRSRTLLARAEVLFNSATLQLHADLDGGSSRVALLFVVPRLARQPDGGSFADEWIHAASQIKADVRAWYFPTPTRTLKSDRWLRFYPEVLLLARSV